MPAHRRITALLAALTTMAGGPFVGAAVADADAESSERGARPALGAGPGGHAGARHAQAHDLAGALGIDEDRLAAVLRELRTERRASDVVGARPAVRSRAQLLAEREAYAAALAAKLDADPATVSAALSDARTPTAPAGPAAPPTVRPPSSTGT